ncbi:MAG: acyloxyacyl hydrolase [Nitrospirales bacterium]|nr:acyloxyacyl hydrolase [Nitrospirales bacterium]
MNDVPWGARSPLAIHQIWVGLKSHKRRSRFMLGVWCFLLFGLVGVAAGADLDARTRVTKGTLEYGMLLGYWQGNNVFGNAPSANRSALYVLPQLGRVLTDPIGDGWLEGNVEVLVEPMAAHYFQPFSASAFGGSLVVKYNFLSFGRWMPFWDGGAGMLWTDLAPRIPEQSTQFNFILQTGPGISYFVSESWAITAGIRFHHISNAGIGDRNIGLNAWLFNLGVAFFTP